MKALRAGVVLLVLVGSSAAHAAALDLTQAPLDVLSGFVSIDYTTSTPGIGTLSISGLPLVFTIVGTDLYAVTGGASLVTAQIDQATGELVSGNILITGAIPSLSILSGTLLSGDLTEFGFTDSGVDEFEFVFNVTGGSLSDAGYWQSLGGIIVSSPTSFSGFSSPFDNNGSTLGAQQDTFAVAQQIPEPMSALALGAMAAIGFARRRQRPLR